MDHVASTLSSAVGCLERLDSVGWQYVDSGESYIAHCRAVGEVCGVLRGCVSFVAGGGTEVKAGEGRVIRCLDLPVGVLAEGFADCVGVGGLGESVRGCAGAGSVRGSPSPSVVGVPEVGRSDAVVGDGFSSSFRKRNKPGKKMRDRLARKAALKGNWRKKEVGGDTCVEEKDKLRESLEAKWAAENVLARARAEQQLAVLRAVDVDQVAKVQETRRKKAIEANMVAMEKSHAFLKATGNVPGEVGFCQTVVSDDGVPELSSGSGSPVCTISPDSSASMKEFRECQKKLLDAEAELKKKDELLIKYGLGKYVKYGEKKTFTVGEDGRIPESVLDEVFPDGYIGEVMSDGKYRAVGMCVETGLPYTEDGSVLGKIEQIKEDRLYAGCN